ncbi:MAG: DUF6596 domain-containing protein [Ilumatobacteraceae bacterium]
MTHDERAVDEVRCALASAIAEQRLRIVAALIRTTGDWDLAEDAVADATQRALQRWPVDGVPHNPAAWLTTTARRRAIDLIRRTQTERAKLAEVAVIEERDNASGGPSHGSTTPMADDRLRLVFTCCHPALSIEARVTLTLRVVANLSTATIARLFLTSEVTVGQRLLRAKQRIAHAGIPYRVPIGDAQPERLEGVLAVIYLVFTEGYATANADVADEAIRVGRLVVELMPEADEARGLLALMLLQHARRTARMVGGNLVTLEQQDRTRWDAAAIAEGLALLRVAADARGSYRLQAELASVHAVASDAASTDWLAIVALYDELLDHQPSPIVALNRAVAIGMSDGPLVGLAALDRLRGEPKLLGHHLVAATRADLLARAGRTTEALAALDQAIDLAPTETERRQLTGRRADLT